MKAVVFAIVAAGGVLGSEGGDRYRVLDESDLRGRFARYAAQDDELYTNAYCNAEAFAAMKDAVPRFECPDEQLTDTYYFRWWTYRKHLRLTPSGWVVTEFLPDVSWAGKYNTISCPFGHHVREGRWLSEDAYLDDYIRIMATEGNVNGPRAYANWPAWGALERAKVTGKNGLLVSLLPKFVANYEAWEKGWTVNGVSLKDVENRQGARSVKIKTGFRADRGLFDFAGDHEGSEFALSHDGARPMVNSALWAEARAIAEIARHAGDSALADRFGKKAAVLEENIKARLWNADKRFFTSLSVAGEQDDVCELHGYAPFYFGLSLGEPYAAAWEPLMRETGFWAPRGLTYPARDTPGFDLSVDLNRHECLWNGPSWPYATSVALTALYETLQSGVRLPLDEDAFAKLLVQYAAQHRLVRADGSTVPWIDENLDPMTGEWIARRHMIAWDAEGVRKLRYRERGKDYNHSTFCDLVIAGLCGLVPQDGDEIVVKPLAPKSWDWWCVDGVRYRGKNVTILFDRDGTKYGKGKGLVVLSEKAEGIAPVSRVGYEGTLPKFYFDDAPEYPFIDLCGCAFYVGPTAAWINDYLKRSIAAMGPRVLQVGVEDGNYRKPDGSRDWTELDTRVQALLKDFPDAKIMPFLRFRYAGWAKAHPDECVGYDGVPLDPKTSDEWAGAPIRPSSASALLRAEILEDVRSYGAYVKSRPWNRNIVGTRIAYGVATEWFTYGTCAFPDSGVAMTKAFRCWLKERYGTEAKLQEAWCDPAVTFETAAVPTRSVRTSKTYFLDPVGNRRTVDFNEMSGDIMADLLEAVARETKKVLPGRLVGAYYGYILTAWPGNSANYLSERMASSGLVDFFCDMAPYSGPVRRAGGNNQQKSVTEIYRRHGRVHILEDDSRLSFSTNWAVRHYSCLSVAEDKATLRRNILNTLFDREGYQICDPQPGKGTPGRPHCFDDPPAMEAMREAFAVLKGVASLPEDSGADVALVVGWRDKFYGDTQAGNPNTGRGWWRMYRDVPYALHRSGAVFDMLSVEGVLASEKRYGKYVFLNAYALTDAERAGLMRLTREPGVKSVWILAPGSIVPSGFSDAAMSELVGMKLAGAGMDPKVASFDPAAKPLALEDGGWKKDLGNGTWSYFLPALPHHADVCAALMDELGEHRYVEHGRYVRRHGDYLMLHVGEAGTHRVVLPARESGRSMTELFSGATFGSGEAVVTSDGPATWMFRIK